MLDYHHLSKRAFTTIELLVSIGIVALLAALALSAVGSVQARSRAVSCLSNQRQVGAAMIMSVYDNNGKLPGPLLYGQGSAYNADTNGALRVNDGALASKLAPYLGLPIPSPGSSLIAAPFVCPAWKALMKRDNGYLFYIQSTVEVGATRVAPFGQVGNQNRAEVSPVRLLAINNAPTTYAFIELDQEGVVEGSSYKTHPNVAPHPVHSTVRNAIFLDGHAEALPVKVN